MSYADAFITDGVQYISCSENGDGPTLDLIVRIVSALPNQVRMDDIIITPVSVRGRLALKIEHSSRARHTTDEEALYIGCE